MKLPKKTRKRLYEAEGKAIAITWPEDAPEPHAGKRYAIFSEEDGGRLFTIRVERSWDRGEHAKVRIDEDPVRILHGLNGIRGDDGGYETEPERIDSKTEDEYAMQGRLATVWMGAQHRQEEKPERKEAKSPTSSRSERAVRRHQKAIERALGSAS